MIRIEDQHRQNSKTKSEIKGKVNLVEDKPKRKFMNPRGKKFKKPNHFHSSSYANSSSFKPSQSSFFKPKTLAKRLMEDSATSVEERITWPQCFNWKKEPVKAQPRGNGGNSEHKVNMVELNSNSFRLDSSLPIVNSITFSSD